MAAMLIQPTHPPTNTHNKRMPIDTSRHRPNRTHQNGVKRLPVCVGEKGWSLAHMIASEADT